MSKNDQELVKQSLFYLPEQILTSFKESCESFGIIKRKIDAVALFGMGGSGLGADIARSMLGQQILVPFVIVNNYTVPFFVDEKTLCICSSYSGNTEEIVEAYKELKKRGAQICVITTGGKLGYLAKKDKIPSYIFEPKYNPSGAPRFGIGYSLGAVLGALNAYGVLGLNKASVDLELNRLFPSRKEIKKYVTHFSLLGRFLAKKFQNRIPIIIGSSHLEGAAHIFANELNETAKNFAVYFFLPELNHHLLEGLIKPKTLKKNLFFLLFESELYHPRIQKRYKITADVFKKQKMPHLVLNPSRTSRIGEAIDVLLIGCFTAFHLAKLNRVNPLPNPWVDYFKKKMK